VTTHDLRREPLFLGFAAACFVFHHVPSFAGDRAGDWIDLVTPFAVLAPAALLLVSLATPAAAVAIAVVAAVLYVDGHGIHLAANSIGHETLTGDAERTTHFWDERFGHIEWHSGWMMLAGALALAEALGRPAPTRAWRSLLGVAALLFGISLFTATVEGGTWWLELAATALFVAAAVVRPRPLVLTCAAAFSLAAALILVWAVWHGGVPEFSEVGWL
jgi:hypothetical protein